MKTTIACLLAAAACVAHGAALPRGYTHTPMGPMRSDCVHAVPSGASVQEQPDGSMLVTHEGRVHSKHAPCQDRDGAPWMLQRTADSHGRPSEGNLRRELQLPADYDGWLEYTAAQNEGGYDAFTGYFSVPDLPQGTFAPPIRASCSQCHS